MAQATTASAPSRPPTNPQTRGERQETRCNDVPFAILFYANLVAMIAVAVIYGPDALDDADQDSDRDYRGYVYAALICSALGVLASLGGVAVMMCIPETLIKVALIFVVVMSGIFMVMMFLAGAFGGAILGLIFFAISICYARVVWPRIPFATANLVTAITAVRSNGGVPRYLFTDFPLGNPCGQPWQRAMQRDVVRRALLMLETATVPRTTAKAPYQWWDAGNWRARYSRVEPHDRDRLQGLGDQRRVTQAQVKAARG